MPVFAAYQMTPRQAFYYHAHEGNFSALQKLKQMGYFIDQSDNKGNSALCEAVWRQDRQAVDTLLRAGANQRATCMQKIPSSYKISVGLTQSNSLMPPLSATTASTGLSTTAIVGIGVGTAALIGGGIALATRGGGGKGKHDDQKGSPLVVKQAMNNNNSLISAENTKNRDVYGLQGLNSSDPSNIVYGQQYSGNSQITLKNTSNGDVYGITGVPIQENGGYGPAYGSYSFGTNAIDITNQGEGNVFGINGVIAMGANDEAENMISITNQGKGNLYGIYGSGASYGTYSSGNNLIQLTNSGNGDIYGIYAPGAGYGIYSPADIHNITANNTIKITNQGNGNVAGLFTLGGYLYGAVSTEDNNTLTNTVDIQNNGDGNVYGMLSHQGFITGTSGTGTSNIINIKNIGAGNTYGMASRDAIYSRTSTINITSVGSGTDYGIYTEDRCSNEANITIKTLGGNYFVITPVIGGFTIGHIHDYAHETRAVGIYASQEIDNLGNITIERPTSWTDDQGTTDTSDDIFYDPSEIRDSAFGIHGAGFDILNTGDITISGFLSAKGIYSENHSDIENSGTISVSASDLVEGIQASSAASEVVNSSTISISGKTAYGIATEEHSDVSNSGTISVSGTESAYGIFTQGNGGTITNTSTGIIDVSAPNAYGIFVRNGTNTTVVNEGIIRLNGVPCTGDCSGDVTNSNYIVLNGATLLNAGLMSAQSINTANFGGDMIATTNAQYNVTNDFSGLLGLSTDFVTQGFNTTYVAKDMINAGDTSKLELKSQSVLFDVNLQGSDVIMQMKGFNTATSNKSLADFLTKNYALGNNEAFFNKLKSFGNMSSLTESLNKLTGKDMLSRFNFEDMTMMRELNYDMNEKLFHNKEQHFALASSVSPMAFKGDTGSNAKYSLYNKRDGNTSIGLGVAFTDVRSDDDHDNNDRKETSYQLILPMGYKTHGFNLLASPRIGYARGTYDRIGFDDKTYDGTIEKRVFGLMNEARYPITMGKWTFEPAAEFNILGYQQKGREDAKEFALNIQNQNTYSVEGGIGLYATREEELDKDTTLKMTAGVVAYHEFADPYKLRVGMNGMDGTFTLRDENRSDNRGVVRAGFDYTYRDLSLYGALMSYIDKAAHTSAKTGMKVKF